MEILICQSCGSILRDRGKTCNACGAFISKFSPTSLPVMSQATAPLLVAVKPNPRALEQMVSKRQTTAVLERSNGNGHGNGNGNGGGLVTPPPAVEPTELTFAPAASVPLPTPAPAPAAEPPGFVPGMPGIEAGLFATAQAAPAHPQQAPVADNPPTLVETPTVAPSPVQANPVQPQAAAMISSKDLGAGFQTVNPGGMTAPPIGAGAGGASAAADFFTQQTTIPPPTSVNQSGLGAGAEAAMGAAVGVAVGIAAGAAINKGLDFFNSQQAQHAPTTDSAPGAQIAEGAPPAVQAAPEAPLAAAASQREASAEEFFPGVTPRAASATPSEAQPIVAKRVEPDSGLDFFAASPVKIKKVVEEDLYPDETHLRGTKTTPSPVSLFVDDEDETKPKIARPRGYKPKEGSAESKSERRSAKDHDDDDDDDADDDDKPKKSGIVQPARRSFTGKPPSKRRSGTAKKDDDDDDGQKDEEKNPRKRRSADNSFLGQDATILGITMSRKSHIIVASIIFFVGFVMFSMVKGLIDQLTPIGPPKAVLTQLPNLSGNWTIAFNNDRTPNAPLAKSAVWAKQEGSAIQGKGSDQYGQFTVTGQLTAPSNIELHKIYIGTDQKKPIVLAGSFTLPSDPLYAKGRWSYTHNEGKFLHAHTEVDLGSWEGNFYPDSNNPPPPPPPPPGWDIEAMMKYVKDMPMSTKGMIAAGLILGLGGLALGGSLWVFGPGGKMNIAEKEKYIPTQYKAQHQKMLGELSKPLKAGGMPLGRRCEWKPWKFWLHKELAITPEIRMNDPHVLILGASDKGKSRFMAKMISHDIEANDRAIVVIDSDGGLAELIAKWIAAHHNGKEIAKRVTFLDPTFKNNSLGYNPLEMPEDEDLQSAASSLVYGFKAIYTEPPGAQSQWNQQTANILRNAAMLLMVNGKTLTDLPALLNDNDFRDVLLESVEKRKNQKAEYITLLDTWGQYKRLARTDQWINWVEPILNRVGPMLSDARIRSILTKPNGDIKLKKLIEEKRILIVKVAKGQLDQNANLLGALIVTGVKQAALSLANERNPKHNPVALYLDEFDNFIEKETIETITSETDKFQIGLIGCIKTLQHLPEDFRNQVIIAIGTLCCFALAKKDGDLLGPQMFRVDGRRIKHQTIQMFFNKVNTQPQFEMVSDEEKLNIDRVVGQDERTFFCYRVGTVAGVFHMKAHEFPDIPESQIKKKIIDKMHGVETAKDSAKDSTKDSSANDR